MNPKPPKKIIIVPYDPAWPALFEQEAMLLKDALGPALMDIFHVGSTAVPGLSAKPVIDIIATTTDSASTLNTLSSLGYTHKGEYNIPLRQFFNKSVPHSVNLHLYPHQGSERHHPEIDLNLTFRDYLRKNPEIRSRYEALKTKLLSLDTVQQKSASQMFPPYTLGKDAFIREILSETGFTRPRMTIVTHQYEQEQAQKLLAQYTARTGKTVPPFGSLLADPSLIHLTLYEGVDMVGYVQLQTSHGTKEATLLIVEYQPGRSTHASYFWEAITAWFKTKDFFISTGSPTLTTYRW